MWTTGLSSPSQRVSVEDHRHVVSEGRKIHLDRVTDVGDRPQKPPSPHIYFFVVSCSVLVRLDQETSRGVWVDQTLSVHPRPSPRDFSPVD